MSERWRCGHKLQLVIVVEVMDTVKMFWVFSKLFQIFILSV